MEEVVNIYNSNGIGFLPNLTGGLDEDGDRIWTDENSEYHREDGPAYIFHPNKEYYYIRGAHYDKDEWLQYLKSGQSSLDQKTLNRIILENS
jgi:hypothetical protein